MMKRIFIYMMVAFLAVSLFTQCTQDDENGNLSGRWKMSRFECPAFTETPDSIFFGFQGKAYSYQQDYKSYDWGMYEITGSTFRFLPMQWDGNFKRIHLNEKSPSFSIVQMSSKKIVLMRNDSVWTLEKFL